MKSIEKLFKDYPELKKNEDLIAILKDLYWYKDKYFNNSIDINTNKDFFKR